MTSTVEPLGAVGGPGADARAEARRLHPLKAMSPRAHLGLRLSGLIVLLAVAVWPRSRDGHPDRAALGVVSETHLAATTAARLQVDEAPRPRAATPTRGDEDDLGAPADDSTLTY
ncbi:MAG: hypothetical protein KF764_30915 [Labilithrix sp.]|nr:hypothetical protein [Labilithrix sp.]